MPGFSPDGSRQSRAVVAGACGAVRTGRNAPDVHVAVARQAHVVGRHVGRAARHRARLAGARRRVEGGGGLVALLPAVVVARAHVHVVIHGDRHGGRRCTENGGVHHVAVVHHDTVVAPGRVGGQLVRLAHGHRAGFTGLRRRVEGLGLGNAAHGQRTGDDQGKGGLLHGDAPYGSVFLKTPGDAPRVRV